MMDFFPAEAPENWWNLWPGHIGRKRLETGIFDPFSLGVEKKRKKKTGSFAVSFGSDIPAGFYSLVLCDLSWDAIAPTIMQSW